MKTTNSKLQLQKQALVELNDMQLYTVNGGTSKTNSTVVLEITTIHHLTVYIPDPR